MLCVHVCVCVCVLAHRYSWPSGACPCTAQRQSLMRLTLPATTKAQPPGVFYNTQAESEPYKQSSRLCYGARACSFLQHELSVSAAHTCSLFPIPVRHIHTHMLLFSCPLRVRSAHLTPSREANNTCRARLQGVSLDSLLYSPAFIL